MSNIILTKVSFAKNVKGFNFKPKLNNTQRSKLLNQIDEVCKDFNFNECSVDDNELLQLKLVNSPITYTDKSNQALIEVLSGEHLNIGCVNSDIYSAYENAKKLDKMFCDKVHFVYDDKLGFLTSNLDLLGSGLQVGIKIMLPAIHKLEALKMLPKSQEQLKFDITDLNNGVYLITTGANLGYSEKDVCKLTNDYLDKIMKYEIEACKQLISQDKDEVEDKSLRAKAILNSCIKIAPSEVYSLVGDILIWINSGNTIDFDVKNIISCIDYLNSNPIRDKELAKNIKKFIK